MDSVLNRQTGAIGLLVLVGVGALLYFTVLSGPAVKDVVDPIKAAVAAAKEQDPPGELVLADVTSFAWDEVFVFGPYTALERINEALGESFGAASMAQIHERDDIVVLVFRRGGKVLVKAPFARSDGDFAASSRLEPIANTAARFELIPLASDPNWVNLSLTYN